MKTPETRFLLLAIALVAAPASLHAQTAGKVARASVTSGGGESTGHAGKAALSADGRFVAFESDASDLVPGDNSGDSDVFVRDRATDVLQRVSVASDGSEANGDSTCPALSADGRYVAFLSRARNMLAGSPNPSFRPLVYVHDRQSGLTSRISTGLGGAEPNADCGCPSISGDGQRIAFASLASNLVGSDRNRAWDVFLHDRASDAIRLLSHDARGESANGDSTEPAISRDGRVIAFQSVATNLLPPGSSPSPARLARFAPNVYLSDLEQQDTELVSVAYGQPATSPDGSSVAPSVSDDGRYVAFRSVASNLVSPPSYDFQKIYVRDRVAKQTWLASPTDQRQMDCGRDNVPFTCQPGPVGPPAISADGRFVAFSSRSLLHLPANQSHGDQIYLFDNLGRRLRRLSVDPTGVPGEACSWEPALSADGTVLAYASKSATIVPDDPDKDADVLAQEWTCDADGRCRSLAACPAEPSDCAAARSSLLRLRKHPPGGASRDQIYWRWYGDASESLPDPTGAGSYQLCLYASGLALDVAAPKAPRCGATTPCWRPFGNGYKLTDPQGALTSLTVSNGPGTGRISLRGGGPLLDAPYLPLGGARSIVAQLQETSTGRCWGAEFPASSISRNVAGVARAGSERDGWLAAEVR